MRIARKVFSVIVAGALAATGCPLPVHAEPPAGAKSSYEEVVILKGDIQRIETKNMKRVSITDPLIADINNAKANGLELVGLASGQTVLFIWDDTGKRTMVVRVNEADLGFLHKRIESLLNSAGITGVVINQNASEGKIILTGRVREERMAGLSNILAPFGAQVLNLVEKEAVEDLIQIDMQVTELNSTLDKEFGVDWSPTTLKYTETLPTTKIPRSNGSFQDLFKVGNFARTPQLIAQVNALISTNKAKILSKPRLVVISGKEATVVVGGEIPIKTTSTTGETTQENIEYKQYGISMSITPTIQENRMIGVTLKFENSSLDDTVTTESGEMALTTATTQTQLILDDQQTIVLAGMIKSTKSEEISRVPVLSAIPLVGGLFRHTSRPDTQKEIVIALTATILRSSRQIPSVSSQDAAAASTQTVVINIDEPATEQDKPVVAVEPASPTMPASPATPAQAQDKPVAAAPTQTVEIKAEVPLVTPTAPTSPVKEEPKPAPVVEKKAPEKQLPPLEAYVTSIQHKIGSAISYPYEAQEKGWHGTVKLELVVRRDGILKSAVVKRSSGYGIFDLDALNTAQALAPYAAFPDGLAREELTLTIPIVYSTDRRGKTDSGLDR
jgi:pilus assembly protein CpaC